MKKLNLITPLLAVFIVLMGCKKETPKETPTCSFVYSAWTSCSNSIQTRTYTSSPSGCTGTPPADSIQRSCVLNQIWTLTNLDVSKFRNGEAIPQAKTSEVWESAGENRQPVWCYYENSTNYGSTYGKLYNWYAVNDSRGLAPTGYHIPSYDEWTILINYLGGESVAGTKMKSTSGWQNNGNGNNSSGFAGLPGGYRNVYGTFSRIEFDCYWWSSSETNGALASCVTLSNSYDEVYGSSFPKTYGFSVRCIKD